jgi:hypothetical protein
MRRLGLIYALIALLFLLVPDCANASLPSWSETWEGYDIGAAAPYGDWNLQAGFSGIISAPGRDGSGQCYTIPAWQVSRIRKWVHLDNNRHIVLQGWLRDTGEPNYSMLGIAGDDTNDDNSMIRIGANGAATYQIQYYDGIAGGGDPNASLYTVDTGMPIEVGWHHFRLDITYTENPFSLWIVKWSVWNAAHSVENKGEFGWWFDAAASNYVTLGSADPTSGDVAWDDISIGSPVVGMSNKTLLNDAAVRAAAKSFHYKTWGWVTPVDGSTSRFYVNDGSGESVLVDYPDNGLLPGQFVSAFGVWNVSTTPPVLESQKGQMQIFF